MGDADILLQNAALGCAVLLIVPVAVLGYTVIWSLRRGETPQGK